MSSSYDPKPWYIKKNKKKLNLIDNDMSKHIFLKKTFNSIGTVKKILQMFWRSLLALILFGSSFYCAVKFFSPLTVGMMSALYLILIIIFLLGTLYLLIAQLGAVCVFFIEEKPPFSNFMLGAYYLRKKIEKSKPQKGLLAPEMILRQFVQQVRIYSYEKNYHLQKSKDQLSNIALNSIQTDLQPSTEILKRRWNDVQDTLDEFEIYLANNSKDVIQNLIVKSPQQDLDVSSIFQEVAELFESIWRPKGINIEHAIVVPLKARVNDKVLKRLLVGPWRSCAYFSPKGGGVIFSAKSENNKIIARWECQGVAFPEKFYEGLQNQNLSVNERIEMGMDYISNNPKNSNILLGLISLIIWHDLASATGIRFSIAQGNEGMIIKVTL